MFYEELYAELGKLFYHFSGIDGKVSLKEKEALQTCINETWKPLEGSTDGYGTDQANLINFAFDFEEAEYNSENYLTAFEVFFQENKSSFTDKIIRNVLRTSKAIAEAYKGSNKKENEIFETLISILKK